MANSTVVVIGGGIAGLSCIEALLQDFDSSNPRYNTILLISDSRIVKTVTNYKATGRSLETFDVTENDIDNLSLNIPQGLRFDYIVGTVKCIDSRSKAIIYNQDKKLLYDTLCISIGAKPRLLEYKVRGKTVEVDSRIILIRDTSSVNDLKEKLSKCRRLVIVGNGGIGLELVSKVSDCEKVWIIRDDSIGYTLFDSGCAKFMMDNVSDSDKIEPNTSVSSSIQYHSSLAGVHQFGPSLGPNWSQKIDLRGLNISGQGLDIMHQDEVVDVTYMVNNEYPLLVVTKKNKHVYCDLVAVAIGVDPNRLEFVDKNPDINTSDGGILIDTQMRTSLNSIYAAGDVVSCEKWPENELWFQMRLWTQARQMGYYAGRCIAAHLQKIDPTIYFNFDCFTHCTTFFGLKLVLLGRYNGQQVHDQGFEVIARVNPRKDYVKILVRDDGRIIGAVLAGESGLEETIENLIHDGIDISRFKNQILDDTVDIEDYFD